MNMFLKKAGLGVALAATALASAAPAEAQRWYGRGYGGYHHHHRGGDVATGALLGGVAGLALGAAIANNNRPRYVYDGYYDRPYRPYYAPTYYPAYQPYYQPVRECWVERRYDEWGYPVRVRVCN